MKPNKKIKCVLFLLAAVLALTYYGICVVFAHAGVSWLWIWPLLAGFCLVRFVMTVRQTEVPKWLAAVYRILAVLFVSAFLLIEGLIIREMGTEPKPGLDYIITLGAAIRNGVPTTPFRLRLETTLEYMNENPDTVCIASGGQGPAESTSEAQCIRDYLSERGIDPGRILTEERSTDTEENIRNSFLLIPDDATVGVVSNSFHLFRAELIAEFQGHSVSGIPAITYPILGPHYIVREFFAVVEILLKQLL